MKGLVAGIVGAFNLFTEIFVCKLDETAEKLESENNIRLVAYYLDKGYSVYEIARVTPMTLGEVASHVRFLKGV